MPFPYSYTHETDLGSPDPERFLDLAAAAAHADGMPVRHRATGVLVVEWTAERTLVEREGGTAPTVIPARLTLEAVRAGAGAKVRVRATFGLAAAAAAGIGLLPCLIGLQRGPSVNDAWCSLAMVGGLWLLVYLLGILGSRSWTRRRVEEAASR